MKNYEQEINEFLAKTGTEITITFIGKAINSSWGEQKLRNAHQVTLKNKRHSYTFIFLGFFTQYRNIRA